MKSFNKTQFSSFHGSLMMGVGVCFSLQCIIHSFIRNSENISHAYINFICYTLAKVIHPSICRQTQSKTQFMRVHTFFTFIKLNKLFFFVYKCWATLCVGWCWFEKKGNTHFRNQSKLLHRWATFRVNCKRIAFNLRAFNIFRVATTQQHNMTTKL